MTRPNAKRDGVRGFCVAATVAGIMYGGGARAQSPTPAQPSTTAPTPKFDVQETPLTAGELAEELGYRYYGNTWKFSEPTFVRVRVWKRSGKAVEVPEQPPAGASWETLYAPDEPQNELTIRALQKKEEKSADGGKGNYTRIEMGLKLRFSSRHAIKETPTHDENFRLTWKGEGRSYTINPDFVKGPEQAFGETWRYGNGSFKAVFEGAVAAALETPSADQSAGQETAEAKVRERMEASLRADPLTVLYYKGEISVLSEQERQKTTGGLYDQPIKRAVCAVTLECSKEPFKADPPAPKPTPAATPTPSATPTPDP